MGTSLFSARMSFDQLNRFYIREMASKFALRARVIPATLIKVLNMLSLAYRLLHICACINVYVQVYIYLYTHMYMLEQTREYIEITKND